MQDHVFNRSVRLADREVRAVFEHEPYYVPQTNNLVCVDLNGQLIWRCQELPVMRGVKNGLHQFMNVFRENDQHVYGNVAGGWGFVVRISDGVIVESVETR